MKHTAGPWEIVPLTGRLDDWTGSRMVIRAKGLPGGICAIIGGAGDEEEGNAHLIAAATQMLEALRTAEIALVNCVPVKPYPGDGPLVEIRKAILAATGVTI